MSIRKKPRKHISKSSKEVSFKFISSNYNNVIDKDNILSSLLSYVYNDLSKRSHQQFDMFTLNELTDLPLILCEKICNVVSVNGTLSLSQFISTMEIMFFSNDDAKNKRRLSFISKILDGKKKKIILKDTVRIILIHLHMHTMNQCYQKELFDIIDNFFKEEDSMTVSEFERRSINDNGDIAYLFYLYFDNFSFGNYDQFDLFNRESETKSEHAKIYKYTVKKYKMNLLSSKAIKYGNRISHKEENEFEPDDDSFLDELENFENELKETIDIIDDSHTKKNPHSNMLRVKTNLTEGTERKNKMLELLSKKRGFHLEHSPSYKRVISTQGNYASPINESVEYDKTTTINIQVSQNYNEIKCFKYSKKQKCLIQVKLIHIGALLFYYKSYSDNNILSIMEDTMNTSSCVSSHTNTSSISNSLFSNCKFYTIPKYTLKRIILTKKLYPSIIKYPDKNHFQLQLTMSIHNAQSVINFYSLDEISLVSFAKTLSHSQHQCGRNITDVYELNQKVGKGQFGSVSIAMHKETRKQVAIKVVSKLEDNTYENYKSNKWENDIFIFLQNASAKCENIIQCYEFFETPNYLYYVCEYIPDGNLQEVVQNEKENLTDVEINEIAHQMVTGIKFLHQYGIIHRDIKLTNTVIKRNRITKSITAKLIDFGLSKAMLYDDLAKEPYGSLSFKAPEILIDNYYSFNVDMWSLGVTIYYLIFKQFPITANNVETLKEKVLNENYEKYICSVLQKRIMYHNGFALKVVFNCLIKDPKRRSNAIDLLRD